MKIKSIDTYYFDTLKADMFDGSTVDVACRPQTTVVIHTDQAALLKQMLIAFWQGKFGYAKSSLRHWASAGNGVVYVFDIWEREKNEKNTNLDRTNADLKAMGLIP